MKILTIANRKGGAGKSTCAAHIAIEAVREGLKTALIDLDPQKTLESWWSIREEDNPYMIDVTISDINSQLEKLKLNKFDFCIIDTPGDTSANSLAGIKVAELVVIPSRPTSPDLTSIGRTISIVRDENTEFVFIISQAISRSTLALQAASILSEFGPVAPISISHRVSYAHAMAAGKSAADLDKLAAEEIKAVWNYLSSRLFEKSKKKLKKKV